jgi:hypothetical protein
LFCAHGASHIDGCCYRVVSLVCRFELVSVIQVVVERFLNRINGIQSQGIGYEKQQKRGCW